jgi:integrase
MPRKNADRPTRPNRGITVRHRNGRYQWQLRLKGRATQSGTADTAGDAWEEAEQRRRKLFEGTLDIYARKVLEEWTLRKLISDYHELARNAWNLKQITGHGYIYGREVKKSYPNERKMIDLFLEHAGPLLDKPLIHDLTNDLKIYRNKRLATGISLETFKRQMNPIKHIWKMARKELGLPLNNPFIDLSPGKPPPGRTRVMSDDERHRILMATRACRTERQGDLWRALIVTAVHTGMRSGEMRKAKLAHVDLVKRTWYIPAENAKNGIPRLLPISKLLRDNLEAYLFQLPERDKTPFSPVFQSQFKRTKDGRALPLSVAARDVTWRRLCKLAGVEGLRFHDLRHTAATYFDSDPVGLTTTENNYMRDGISGSTYIHALIENIRTKLDRDYKEERSLRISDVTEYSGFFDKFKQYMDENSERVSNEKVLVYKIDNDRKDFLPIGSMAISDATQLLKMQTVGWFITILDAKGVVIGNNHAAFSPKRLNDGTVSMP